MYDTLLADRISNNKVKDQITSEGATIPTTTQWDKKCVITHPATNSLVETNQNHVQQGRPISMLSTSSSSSGGSGQGDLIIAPTASPDEPHMSDDETGTVCLSRSAQDGKLLLNVLLLHFLRVKPME
jgi:hypothetical protein